MKQPLFNSLGSSYQFSDAVAAIKAFFAPDSTAKTVLTKELQSLYPDFSVQFAYKGRDALTMALQSMGVGVGDVVLTQAFSCFSVEEAIIRCGAIPWYYDIEPHALAPSSATLNQSLARYYRAYEQGVAPKVLIAQYSLGSVASAANIQQWANRHHVSLLADLAQALGGEVAGQPLGLEAEAVVFSSGRDKVWDAVNGGVALTRQPVDQKQQPSAIVHFTDLLRDAFYPLLTLLIRKTYSVLVGRMLHRGLIWLQFFRSPIETQYANGAQLPDATATVMLSRWQLYPAELKHRRKIAQYYQEHLAQISLVTDDDILHGSNLRFPVAVENIAEVLVQLKAAGIHLADRWYRSAVDVGTVGYRSQYQAGSCPNAEKLATMCLNLPTHRGVTLEQAKHICQILK